MLRARHGLVPTVTAVGTRHGSLVAREGLSPADLPAGGRLPCPARPAAELLAASAADVLIETTVMEHDFAPISTNHIEIALGLGMDVVTANKGPVAWNWSRLAALAQAHRRRIRFESTVMDGLPVFSLLEYALPGCTLLGFEAVFNATTNAMLEAIGEGLSFEESLREMQIQGCAEADPADDIDGWDAAYKAAVLANVSMAAAITPPEIARTSLRNIQPQQIRRARQEGRRLRLVTRVARDGLGQVSGALRAEELDIGHPLAGIGPGALGAVLHTDLMGPVVVAELRADLPQTAYGLLADLLHLYGKP